MAGTSRTASAGHSSVRTSPRCGGRQPAGRNLSIRDASACAPSPISTTPSTYSPGGRRKVPDLPTLTRCPGHRKLLCDSQGRSTEKKRLPRKGRRSRLWNNRPTAYMLVGANEGYPSNFVRRGGGDPEHRSRSNVVLAHLKPAMTGNRRWSSFIWTCPRGGNGDHKPLGAGGSRGREATRNCRGGWG